MLYLVTGQFEDEEDGSYADWKTVFGVTDNLSIGKEWISECKKHYEEIGEIDSYEENEEGDYFSASFHVILPGVMSNEYLSCFCSVKQIELNTKISK